MQKSFLESSFQSLQTRVAGIGNKLVDGMKALAISGARSTEEKTMPGSGILVLSGRSSVTKQTTKTMEEEHSALPRRSLV
jgi:hypothetical protein